MDVSLKKATEHDARAIFDMQVASFMPLLERYKDYDTNPANESIERVHQRIQREDGEFYKIYAAHQLVGAIYIRWKDKGAFWMGPLFILPADQGKGIAQRAIGLVEEMFPHAQTWELATILEEKGSCYLYEKVGYELTGESHPLNEHATLIFYKKTRHL
ncbi:acetyltransferase [Fictibacillus macauensis ZFHKF-1]|uniref:Acetyltransferase n=1 Tax=Fictibacillus macauensis ZFHKF-1 TaxID=1196324 RepID=I8AEX2_9BACL|nr:GNAT family N-acetyltransferase [Fictibacillus macauensis]EIT83899.1 acetyltransferase [Fictibacillus macauensis ZFHKF-1]